MEATTNLIGGQPFSMANLREVKALIEPLGIFLVVDGSLISENAYFIRQREEKYKDTSIGDIIREVMEVADLCYLSARKSCSVRGGLIATNRKDLFDQIRPWLPLYEGFYTYGGMSSKEIEAMAVGMREMTELEVAGASADQVKYFVALLQSKGIPVVTPAGGLACHVDARRFIPHVPSLDYPAGALAAAVYLISGARGMERGTVSMDRDAEGNDVPSDLELLRLAVPRRVYTMSHFQYVADRLQWLLAHRELVGGLEFYEEPPVLRFFAGKMKPKGNWGVKLAEAFEKDFGPEC
jgi:tryptophanase